MTTCPGHPNYQSDEVLSASRTGKEWVKARGCTELYGLSTQNNAQWIDTKQRSPERGWIVKRWDGGTVWAGYFDGSSKVASCDQWLPLPAFQTIQGG